MSSRELGDAVLRALQTTRPGSIRDMLYQAGNSNVFGTSSILANPPNKCRLIDLRRNDAAPRIYTVSLSVVPQQDDTAVANVFRFVANIEWGIGSALENRNLVEVGRGLSFTVLCQCLAVDMVYAQGSANVSWLATATIAETAKSNSIVPSVRIIEESVNHGATSAQSGVTKYVRQVILQTSDAAGTLAGNYRVNFLDGAAATIASVATNGFSPIDVPPQTSFFTVTNATAATDNVNCSLRGLLDFG